MDGAWPLPHAASDESEASRAARLIFELRRIEDAGHDFAQAQPLLDAAAALLAGDGALAPPMRGALRTECAIVELVGAGRLRRAQDLLGQAMDDVERSDDPALAAVHAACTAYGLILSGHLRSATTLLDDAMAACPRTPDYGLAHMHLLSVRGLLETLLGRHEVALSTLAAVVASPAFERLPDALWLLAQGHRLHAMAAAARPDEELRHQSALIWDRAARRGNRYVRSYAYFSFALTDLVAGRCADALVQARRALALGEACHSDIAQRTPAVLVIQALAREGRMAESRQACGDWMARWQDRGARLLESSVWVERAAVELDAGKVALARDALGHASAAMPNGEDLPSQFRPAAWVQDLVERLLPGDPAIAGGSAKPVEITTFGGLAVRVRGRRLYDRDWHGVRTKSLLKAMIVLGGSKVSQERLCDWLWPGAEGDRALASLKVALSRMRRLGLQAGEPPIPWVVQRQGTVSIVSALCDVDAIEFRRSPASQRARYVGDFLPHDDSEPWIVRHREELRGLARSKA